jgi:hypothetical protein
MGVNFHSDVCGGDLLEVVRPPAKARLGRASTPTSWANTAGDRLTVVGTAELDHSVWDMKWTRMGARLNNQITRHRRFTRA